MFEAILLVILVVASIFGINYLINKPTINHSQGFRTYDPERLHQKVGTAYSKNYSKYKKTYYYNGFIVLFLIFFPFRKFY